jgi:peptidoglycan/xylan/chitin deacetylase (PgdA/CDA1 family)
MILMYHHVCPVETVPAEAERSALAGWEYRVEPADFEKQLLWLQRKRYHFVSLAEYVRTLRDQGRIFGRIAAVTFDDGWRDNHEYAFPILRRLGIPATFFIVSGEMAGVPSSMRMEPVMLRELADGGMEIGGHSRSHPNLAALPDDALDGEIRGCREDLAQVVGKPIRFFAYPGGRHDGRVIDASVRAGYEAACSVEPWGGNDRSRMFRLYRDVLGGSNGWWRDSLVASPAGRWLCGTLRKWK